MKNYSEEQIQNIKNHLEEKEKFLDQGLIWVEKNLKYDEKSNLLLKLKGIKSIFRKIKENIGDKPVMAVFGASQVGKSYLIQNLLSADGKPFLIYNDGTSYDFLKEINPPGVGAESTGVVTRFTVDANKKYDDYPIKIKLLSAKDILTILFDSYFLDLKRVQHPFNPKEIDENLRILENEYNGEIQSYLTELDVLEIKDYFDSHLDKHVLLFEALKASRFFERVGRIIGGFNPDQWLSIFNVLWHKNQRLNDLFSRLINALNQLSFLPSVYVKFDEVLREKGAILDVRKLKNMNESTQISTIKTESGETKEVNLSLLSALIKELVFTIPKELKELKPFLEHSDLLDFPGARSRLGIEYDEITEALIPDMLLRGKVSYLFNKYSDEFNVNNLLFCIKDSQLEVTELPSLLDNWIKKNIGVDAQQRSVSLKDNDVPPLFVIYTFFNNQLKFNQINDENFEDFKTLDYKWKARFNYNFKEEIVTKNRDWDVNWTRENPKFNNMYILRDFKYSDDTFDGFEKEGKEIDINSNRIEFLKKLKLSFLEYPFVDEHFKNPKELWDGATEINKNGSEMIIQSLNKVSNNVAKVNYYLGKIERLTSDIKSEFEQFAHMDDIEKRRRANMQKANEFQFSFNPLLVKNENAFDEFLNLLLIEPKDIYNLLNENLVVNTQEVEESGTTHIFVQQYPALKSAETYEQAIQLLKKELWLNSTEEVEKFLDSQGIDRTKLVKQKNVVTKAERFVNLIIENWIENINQEERFKYFTLNNVKFSNISFINEHLIEILERRKIAKHLIKITNDITSEVEDNHGVEEFLAETMALPINDMVLNFDVPYFGGDVKNEFMEVVGSRSFPYYEKMDDEPDSNIEHLFERELIADSASLRLNKYNEWLEFLKVSLLVNSGFANYDTEANEELLRLLENLKPINSIA